LKTQYCSNFHLIATTQATPALMWLSRLRCGMWSCDFCAEKNQSIWRAFLRDKLPKVSHTWWLVTLTAASYTREAQSSYANLQAGIDKLLKRARRVWTHINYVRVFEKHPTSEALHAHFIMSGLSQCVSTLTRKTGARICRPVRERMSRRGYWSVQTWWKVAAYECGMGYQVDVKPVGVERAAHYVTKYLTKSLQGITIKGLRHVQTSRNIGSPKIGNNRQWQVRTFVTKHTLPEGSGLYDLKRKAQLTHDYILQIAARHSGADFNRDLNALEYRTRGNAEYSSSPEGR